jgi:Ca2+-binding EF-hand superfamily protein
MTWRTCRSTATANARARALPKRPRNTTRQPPRALAVAVAHAHAPRSPPTRCAVSANEIQSLFARFRALDRRHKGYIGGDELLSVPELAINPLAQRVVQLLGACNFKDFVALLSAFSARGSRTDALRFMFTVHDVDGDGLIGRADLLTIARARAGGSLADEQLAALVDRALPGGAPLTFEQFCEELGAEDPPASLLGDAAGANTRLLHVKVPTDF